MDLMDLLPSSGWQGTKLIVSPGASITNPRLYYSPCGDLFVSSTTGVICIVKSSDPNSIYRYCGYPNDNNDQLEYVNGDRLSEATFRCPRGMVRDDAGLLVADANSHVIRLISGERVITFAGTTEGFADGNGAKCKFKRPVCIVKHGPTIFVSEENMIRMIGNNCVVTSIRTTRKTSFSTSKLFCNQSFLMVSPDGRKVYELHVSGYNQSVYSLVYTRLDSKETHKITLGTATNDLDNDDVPSITSTPEGYIIFMYGSYTVYDWNTDLPIGEKNSLPLNNGSIVRFYQASVSPSCGTLVSITTQGNDITRHSSTGDVSLELVTFTRLFVKPWKPNMPSTLVDFSTMFDCEVGSDVELVLDSKEGEEESASAVIKLHSAILLSYPHFSDIDNLRKILENLKNMKNIDATCKRLFLQTLYRPDCVAELLHLNSLKEYGFEALSHVAFIIHLYRLFKIDSKSLRCTLWNMLYDSLMEGAVVVMDKEVEATLVEKDTNAEANQDLLIKLFFFIWKNCGRSSYELLDIVVSFMTVYPDIFFDRWSTFSELMTSDAIEMSQCMELFFHLTAKGKRTLRRTPIDTFITEHCGRHRIEPSLAIYKHLQNLFQNACYPTIDNATIPDGMFRIGIIGCEKYLHAHYWVLYSRWHFFRRMFVVGGEEISSRHILLPPEFPFELLECIIQILYYQHPQLLKLNYDTCLFFIDQGAQFDLTDFEHGEIEPFRKLHLYCSLQVFQPLTVSNCIRMTVLYSQIKSEEHLNLAIKFTALNFPAAISASPQELRNVSADLLYRISQLHSSPTS